MESNTKKPTAGRLFQYLLRHRAPSTSLPFPYLNGFHNTTSMRLSVLNDMFTNMKESGTISIDVFHNSIWYAAVAQWESVRPMSRGSWVSIPDLVIPKAVEKWFLA